MNDSLKDVSHKSCKLEINNSSIKKVVVVEIESLLLRSLFWNICSMENSKLK